MFQNASTYNQDLCAWNDHLGFELSFSDAFTGSACYGGATIATTESFEPHRFSPLCGLCSPFEAFQSRAELRNALGGDPCPDEDPECDPTFSMFLKTPDNSVICTGLTINQFFSCSDSEWSVLCGLPNLRWANFNEERNQFFVVICKAKVTSLFQMSIGPMVRFQYILFGIIPEMPWLILLFVNGSTEWLGCLLGRFRFFFFHSSLRATC